MKEEIDPWLWLEISEGAGLMAQHMVNAVGVKPNRQQWKTAKNFESRTLLMRHVKSTWSTEKLF